MRLALGNERAIRAFFSLYERPLGTAELSYYLQVFGGQYDVRHDAPHNATSAFLTQYRLASRKWRRALRVAGWFAALPWIKGIAIVNTLSQVSVKEESDIDLLILCTRGRVWLARLCVNIVLGVLRLRPGEARRDPVCPTFFVDEDHFDLSTIALPDGDVYLHFWLANVAPVWDFDGVFARFFADNAWALTRTGTSMCGSVSPAARLWRRLWRVCDTAGMERLARALQRRLFTDAVRTQMATPGNAVVVHDGMIKLHVNDRRAMLREQWYAHYAALQKSPHERTVVQ